jgi:hypothetical protein
MPTMRANTSFSIRVSAALLLGALGCGLISSDITKLTFDLPKKKYTFTTQGLMVPAGANVQLTCGAGGVVPTCPAPSVCEAGICTVHYPISVVQKMDLKKDAAQVAQYSSLANITIDRIGYDVVSTANIDIPEMSIYLAPLGVTSPDDPQAVKFGTVGTIPAGATTSGEVVKEPNADATFAAFAADLTTAFNFIAATTVTWVSGTPVPSGTVDITISGRVAAKPF